MDWLKQLCSAVRSIAYKSAKAIIRKDGPSETPYCVYSEKGRKFGCYSSMKKAKTRLAQIEMFKHINEEGK